MKELAKVWIGAGIVVLVYLILCEIIESHEDRVKQCSVVRCT